MKKAGIDPKILGVVLVLLILPAWEAIRIGGSISPLLMPPLVSIGSALLQGLIQGTLLVQIGLSLMYILTGAGIALVLAFFTLWISNLSPAVHHAVGILGALFHPLPGIVLLPIIILWAGIGPSAVLVVIVHSVFWPVLTNLQAGYRSIPETWRMTGQNYELAGWKFLVFIALPATFPYLLAGLRIAWARGWRALISAEMLFGAIAGAGGLGWYIHSRRVFMDSPGLFAGILVIMLIGSLVESMMFSLIERRTIQKWGMSL